MKAPAYRLHIAIAEAIQAHADYHNSGKTDLEKALSALGEAALQLLADIPDVTSASCTPTHSSPARRAA